jgi:hypothetical protein
MPVPVKLLAFALGSYASPGGGDIRPGEDALAEATDSSTRTVRRNLTILQNDYGLIERVRRGSGGRDGGNSKALYRLTLPTELAAQQETPDTQVAGESLQTPDTQVAGESGARQETPATCDRNTGHHSAETPDTWVSTYHPETTQGTTQQSACVPEPNARKPLAAPLANGTRNSWHSPAAHRIVEAHAAHCRQRPPSTVLTNLAVQVDGLLAESWPEPLIERAVNAWSAKGLDPKSLHSVANEVANRDPPVAANGHRPSTTDARVLAAQALKTSPRSELEGGQT